MLKPQKTEKTAEQPKEKPAQPQFGATAGGWAQADVIRLPDQSGDNKK